MDASSVPHRAFAQARLADTVAMSRPVMEEIVDVLNRPSLARYIDPLLRDDMLDRLTSASVWFDPGVTVTDGRDPTDNKYLELALVSAATTIVSGDSDLLVLDPWRRVRIMRPAAYLAATANPPPQRGTG